MEAVPSDVPSRFRVRALMLGPGERRPFFETEWGDAMVVVERGEIEVECRLGERRRFSRGAILWLAGVGVQALHNPGRRSARLVAISRKEADETDTP